MRLLRKMLYILLSLKDKLLIGPSVGQVAFFINVLVPSEKE